MAGDMNGGGRDCRNWVCVLGSEVGLLGLAGSCDLETTSWR